MIAQFRTPLRFEDNGGLPFTLISALVYDCALLDQTLYVPAQFQTDLASIPRGLWNVLPKIGKWDAASVLHDFLYSDVTSTLTREQADRIFLEAMESCEVGWWARRVLYWGVRAGGGGIWKRYREVAGV